MNNWLAVPITPNSKCSWATSQAASVQANPWSTLSQGEHVKQSLAVYEKGEGGEVSTYAVLENRGQAVTGILPRQGKQPPCYDFFLNIYQDDRFLTCPQCKGKTRLRDFSLVINVDPKLITIMDKRCRFCNTCDLLIAHQNEQEEQLAEHLIKYNPELIGNVYQVIGTIEKEEWKQGK